MVEESKSLQTHNTNEERGNVDDVDPIFSTGVGINEETIRKISLAKQEPEWMLALRLKAYQIYLNMPLPNFGPDLSPIDLDNIKYFQRATNHVEIGRAHV